MISSHIFQRYFVGLSFVAAASVVIFGAIEAGFGYVENVKRLSSAQAAEIRFAESKIITFLRNIELQVAEVSQLPWDRGFLDREQMREEFHRMLKLIPAIIDVAYLPADDGVGVFVSRAAIDDMALRPESDADEKNQVLRPKISYGSTEFERGGRPRTKLCVRPASGKSATCVTLDLTFLSDVVSTIKFSDVGVAYVVDAQGNILAHPSARVAYGKRNARGLGHISTRRGTPAEGVEAITSWGKDLDGHDILASVSFLDNPNWAVVVEQPREVLLRPVVSTLWRTAGLLVLALLLSLIVSWILARYFTSPILGLRNAVKRFAENDLSSRFTSNTKDEVADLANEFNKMADQLQSYTTSLEQKVSEKTAQLELANRHKSEFLANMSHELRTPLNAVIGFSDVLNEQYFGELNAKQQEYVKDINESGQHLLSLINDILDLSKIEAGHMDLDLTAFSVPMAIENAIVLVRERALRHQLQLRADIAPEVAEIVADQRKFKQILINLLTNAVKFSYPNGWVEVVVRRDTNGIMVTVKDSGMGVAAEDHAAIFEEFRQLKSSGSAKLEGTGLGLSLAKSLVELHGGRIWVESELGKGAAFTFLLPDGVMSNEGEVISESAGGEIDRPHPNPLPLPGEGTDRAV